MCLFSGQRGLSVGFHAEGAYSGPGFAAGGQELFRLIHAAQHRMPNLCLQSARTDSPWVCLCMHMAHASMQSDSKFHLLMGTSFISWRSSKSSNRGISLICVALMVSVLAASPGRSSAVMTTTSFFRVIFRSVVVANRMCS